LPPASLSSSAPASLPVIDLTGLRSPHPADRLAVAQALKVACAQRGFFYVTQHGIEPELTDAVFAQSRQLFDLPMQEKALIHKAHSRFNRGYEPLRGQTLQPGMPPDVKEGFYIGNELALDDPRVLAGKFNHGPNQWPPGLPGFRPVMERYFARMLDLGQLLMGGLALSLGMPQNAFDDFLTGAMGTVRLLHYPPQPANPHPGEKGCGEHTDFGCITLLLQDLCGGLQVWDAEGQGWIDAPPLPGAYVVNLGDLIARWTNGRYHSTLHRVVNSSGRERYSVPFFLTGRPDYEVACLPSCLGPGELPRHPPITVEQHLTACYRRTYT
jgi:isopenicillin N synthase-like dioxygenase